MACCEARLAASVLSRSLNSMVRKANDKRALAGLTRPVSASMAASSADNPPCSIEILDTMDKSGDHTATPYVSRRCPGRSAGLRRYVGPTVARRERYDYNMGALKVM